MSQRPGTQESKQSNVSAEQGDPTPGSEVNVVNEQQESIRPMSVPEEEVVEEAEPIEEEEKPFYGEKRYDIVDDVLARI